MNQGRGVWANAVFGKFNDRGVGRGFLNFTMLLKTMEGILLRHGWSEGSYRDSTGGAAVFMALATVNVYVVISLTCIHAWCAHFAEVIVKAHLLRHLEYHCMAVRLRSMCSRAAKTAASAKFSYPDWYQYLAWL